MPAFVDEHVELAEALQRQIDEGGKVVAPPDIRPCEVGLAACRRYSGREGLEPVQTPRAEHELRAARRKQERSRLADAAARAGDGDDLALNSFHEILAAR